MSTETHKMTGTVVSVTADAMVIDTATGRVTYTLDPSLDRVGYARITPGQRVEVVHRVDAQGANAATNVVVLTDQPPSSTTPRTDAYGTSSTTDQDNRVYRTDDLPQTASPWTMLAAFSLAALLAGGGFLALGVRRGSRS
jgi:hypothetical protein